MDGLAPDAIYSASFEGERMKHSNPDSSPVIETASTAAEQNISVIPPAEHQPLDARIVAGILVFACRLLTGVRARWLQPFDWTKPQIFYANHTSHLDGLVIWASMPQSMRNRVHPVAAADYWLSGRIRRYLAQRVFKAVLVQRGRVKNTQVVNVADQVDQVGADSNQSQSSGGHERRGVLGLREMSAILERGESLIIFPEGTRGNGEELGTFRSGLWHLARQFPAVSCVPVYLENLNRVLPKGSWLVVPIICSATIGRPLAVVQDDEHKTGFLTRARQALEEMMS